MDKEPKHKRILRPNRRDSHMKLVNEKTMDHKVVFPKAATVVDETLIKTDLIKTTLKYDPPTEDDYNGVFPISTAAADETLLKVDLINELLKCAPPTEEELGKDMAYLNRIYSSLKNLKL